MVPVLVLLTVFVLWAGRGGRAALTADLAAEEAVTAAALCCEDDDAGGRDREALVEDMLEARPGLGFLCIGGPRPNAGDGSEGFLSEEWVEFEPGREVGGVGVLGVRFLCESDGAVAPLRGVFPTVTFHGQAAEVVQRESSPSTGFTATRFPVTEALDPEPLVFTVSVHPTFGEVVTLTYKLDLDETTAEPEDFGVSDFAALDAFGLVETDLVGTVEIGAGKDSAEIVLPLVDDGFFEGDEELVLELTGALPPSVVLDDDRMRAAGVIEDNDPRPYLFISGPDPLEEVEGGRRTDSTTVTAGTLTFQVRLRDETGTIEAPSATDVSVDVRIEDITTTGSDDYTPADPAASMWSGGSTMLRFDPGVVAINVVVGTVDDDVGEETEKFRLVLEKEAGALLGSAADAVGTIIDDEVRVSVESVSAQEGDASTPGMLRFQVVLDRAPNADLSLRYELVDPDPSLPLDTARRGTPPCAPDVDYLDVDSAPAELTITWHADPVVAVDLPDVTICGDSVVEPDETLWLSMWVPNGGEAVMEDHGGAFGTILNDDIPVIIVDDETASEAPAGGMLVFAVRVEVDGSAAVLDEDVTVQYDIVGHSGTDSATAIDDFRAPSPGTLSGTLRFAAGGDTEIDVLVELPADYLPENTETFHLVLSNPSANAELFDRDSNNSIDEPYAVGTIEDDAPPVLSVSGFRGPEDSTQSFTVELDMAPRAGETVMVDYAITGGTGTGQAAVPGSARPDFCVECDPDVPEDGLSGTLIFPGGTAQRTVGVSLLRDTAPEGPETLTIALSNARHAYLDSAAATATGTIDDVDPPYLFVGNTSAREGVPLTFTVALCNPVLGQEVTVKYETVERSAKAGLAFEAVDDTLTFSAALESQEVTEEEECGAGVTADAKLLPVVVQTLRDRVEESDQEVHLVLSGQTPAASVGLGKSIGVGRIINVSAATVRVNDPVAVEGRPLGFTISLVDNDGDPAVITEDVTVFYATADRTATAGADYTPVPATPGPCLPGTAPPGVVTFARNSAVDPSPGRTHSVEVRTCPDTEDEDDETVALVLSLAAGTVNAGLGDTEGIGTIFDVTPGLRIADVTAVEGEPLVFRVSLVDDDGGLTSTSEAVSFTVSTEDGTATDGTDYTAVTDRRLEIPAADSWVDVVVETIGDDRIEPPETVRAVLSSPTGASSDRGVAIGTITEACITIDGDDDPGAIVLYDVRAFEDSGEVVVEASLSRPLCEDTPAEYRYVDGTATSARDYAGVAGLRELSVPASGTVHRRFGFVGIGLTNDRLDEDDETFTVEVNWVSSLPAKFRGKPPGVAVVTIRDDDPLPGLSVADASADEGEAVTFEVMLTPASGRTVTVQYRTTDGSAVAGTDYDQGPATPPGTWTTIEFEPDPSSGETPTSATFTVQTHADADDVDETFWVELRALDPADPDFVPVNAQIDDGVAVGTILEGDLPEMRISDASGYEGEDLAFVVELSEAASQPVTVSYETVSRPAGPRSATAGVDYTPPAAGASLTFGVGDPLTQTVYVAARDDGVEPEADETFLVELSGAVGASLADPSAVGTINGDLSCIDAEDPGADPPGWTPADPISAPEDAGPMIFSFELDMPYCQSTSFRYVTNGSQSTATNGVDYEHRNRRASVEGLQAVVSFEVPLIDDDINEDDETIVGQVRESGLNPVKIDGDFFLTGTIIDDDREVAVSVNDVDTDEGDYLTFTVRLDRPSDRAVTVAYVTESGPVPSAAAAAADYTPADSTVTIPAGELSAPVRVRTLQDLLDEADETVGLRLSNPQIGWSPPQAAVFAPGGDLGVGTITDDDVPPSLRVSDASVDEGGTLVFVVTLDAPSGREVSVPVATRDGPARAADGDYVGLASSVVVFAPGVTRQTVSVQTRADDVVESAEFVWLDLGPMGDGTATIGDDTGRGVIRDVSDRRLSVSDADVVEGGTLAFEVGFAEGPSSRDVTVRYRTRSGTAAADDDYDDDYESAPQELRIVAGDTSATVSVPTVPDTLNEDNESLELVLSDPQGAVIVAGSASGTIIDDDPLPELRVGNTEASEGVGASAAFTLSLGEASGRDVTVAYSTADLTADAGDDYIAVSDGEVVIAAGDRQATVDVALVDDDVAEDVETFRLVVSSAVNASRGDSVGVATVTDDDGLVQILVDDPAAVHEGDGASAVFTVRLSHAHPTEAVTVMYSTADGTAIAGSDYTAATSQTLTFAVTDTTKTVSVPLINDDVAEPAETFRLVLSSPGSNAELGDGEATVLIRDDDGLPTVSVADAATRTEGATASFTVTLSRAVPREVTVDYATRADPTAAAETAAVPGQDYTAASGTVTFAARATEATVTVPLLGDALDEHTETFWLRLASPTGATIADGTAIGTIADDDPLPEITIADAGATEGAPVSFEVRLTPFSGRTVTVPWTTEARPPGAGAASPGSDYTAASGTLTLAPGTTTARVEVATLPDDVSEADETFLVHLGTPANAALDDSTASGAIRDDDGVPRVFIADTTVDEDDGPAIFTVTLSHPSSQPVTVEYNTADGTAEDPDDYAPDLVRTLTIPATFTGGEISVFIADDDEGEGTETFTITLTDPVNAVIAEGAGTAVGYIVDDEGQPRLTVSDAEECEDGSSTADCEVRICRIIFPRPIEELSACAAMLLLPGACQPGMCTGDGTLEFSVQLSHASSEETSVRYTIFERGAVDPRDYVASSGTLRIPAGDVSAAIPVVLVDDAIDEEEVETFLLRLDDPVGVELVVAEAVGTILDDDLPPRVAAEPFDAFSNENDGFAYHRVTLSDPSDLTATMDYVFEAVDDRSEFAGIDPTPGTLTFAPGVVQQTIEVPLIDNSVATFAHGDGVSWRHATTLYRLNLNNRVNARTGIDTSLGVVWDDETSVYVESVAAQDILEGAGAATFTIALNRFSDTAVTATYQTVDGTAAAGIDYTAAEATVTFPPGTITATVTVAIIDDTDIENDESFTLRIIDDARNSNLTYLAQPLSDGHGTGFGSVLIIDDDSMPEVSVAGTRANEDAGTMTLWVSLSRGSATAVTVDFATADGTATAGSDYTATNGTLTIPAGATGAGVSVTILDDTADTESDETFTLNLSNAVGATIADADATAIIIEDANLPTLTMSDVSQTENIVLESPFIGFRPRIDGEATRTITVDWQVVEVPSLGDEAATIGADFLASPSSGTFTILPRPTIQRPVPVFRIVPDVIPERDERFQVILSNPRGARLGNTRVWGTIRNDDVPIVSVADVEASESDGAVVFTLQLHEPGLDPASLRYTTMVRPSEGQSAASPGDDYTTAWGTLNIPAGDTTATISVPIIADSVDEADETFLLVLTNPDTLEFRDSTAVGTITDDDPGWVIDDRSVREDAGSMVFTVRRDHTSPADVTVEYRFGSGGAAVGGVDCAVDGVDFEWPSGTSATGTVTMPAADRAAAISVRVCNDDDPEGRENLLIELTNVTGRKTTGVGTIVDDD